MHFSRIQEFSGGCAACLRRVFHCFAYDLHFYNGNFNLADVRMTFFEIIVVISVEGKIVSQRRDDKAWSYIPVRSTEPNTKARRSRSETLVELTECARCSLSLATYVTFATLFPSRYTDALKWNPSVTVLQNHTENTYLCCFEFSNVCLYTYLNDLLDQSATVPSMSLDCS